MLAANSSARYPPNRCSRRTQWLQRAFQIQLVFVYEKQWASKQRFFGRLAGFSRTSKPAVDANVSSRPKTRKHCPRLQSSSCTLLHETKINGTEKSRIRTNLVEQNLVTQHSRFAVLRSDLTGKISPNFGNHSHGKPRDFHLNYAYKPHKMNPRIFQVHC